MPATHFPAYTIKDALQISETIATQNAGQPMRRLDIFDHLDKSPESGPSRSLITASSTYGLTKGGYQAETLDLTELGRRIVVDQDGTATIDAIFRVDIFRQFFEKYRNSTFPADVPAKSYLADNGISVANAEKCVKLIRANGQYAGLIKTLSGAERIVSRDAAAEALPTSPPLPTDRKVGIVSPSTPK